VKTALMLDILVEWTGLKGLNGSIVGAEFEERKNAPVVRMKIMHFAAPKA